MISSLVSDENKCVLEKLNLSSCQDISDVGLKVLFTHLSKLQDVNISLLDRVKGESIVTLAQVAQKTLKHVNFSGLYRLKCCNLTKFVENSTNLETLNLAGVIRIE